MKDFLGTLLGIVLVVLIFIGIFQGTFAGKVDDNEEVFKQKMETVDSNFSNVSGTLGK